MYFISKTAN